MNLLLDTHAVIWWLQDNKKLGPRTRRTMLHHGTEVFISSASIWEISLKSGTGRLKLSDSPQTYIPRLLDSGFHPLAITFEHAAAVRDLAPHHTDPFDRLLIAQAQCENLIFVTADSTIAAYNVRTVDASE
ncbi:MAG TPA: type II toxin-antitoxin system VapC family toxin [Bryobacteraceae bacterium]|nr:type II toxin-antitoxin system VapC family toxin [Bryobacteraceae bacterium]